MNDGERRWAAVDTYIDQSLGVTDAVLEAALRASDRAGLPAIHVSANQGRLLQLLAQVQGARAILEIGTLAGYSTICLARGLPPDGRLITLELNPDHAVVATANINRAQLQGKVEVRVGPALETLPRLDAESRGPFDLVFIDADKPTTPEYFQWALRLSRPGTLIIVDNVVRKGSLIEEKSEDPAVSGMRRFMQMLGTESRVLATVLQTVGSKGYDGFAIARVRDGT